MSKEHTPPTNLFQTSDLCLATTLYCLNYQLKKIDKKNPKKVVFIFKKDNRLKELLTLYYNHTLSIEPNTFSQRLREIKNRLYTH